VDTIEHAFELGQGFLGGGAAHFGAGARAEPLRDRGPELDAVFGDGVVERLRVVLATTKSTPSIPAVIMLAIALPPAPPTPITVIRGRSSSMAGGPMLMLMVGLPFGLGSGWDGTRDRTRNAQPGKPRLWLQTTMARNVSSNQSRSAFFHKIECGFCADIRRSGRPLRQMRSRLAHQK
jgi:hypothetical protein